MIKKIQYLIFLLVISVMRIVFAGDDVITVDLHIQDHRFTPDIIELPANKKISIIVFA